MIRTGPRFSNRFVAAASEVGLIFLGITLAIAFENWNDERAERDDEQSILADLQADLRANIDELENGLEYNRRSVARIDSVMNHVEGRLPYTPELSSSFAYLENWASPYLNRSAYETLKSRGVNIIRDRELRQGVVGLYESVYVHLVSDDDRAEWINYEVSMLPLMLRVVEERPGSIAEPIDYASLLDDRAFRTALLRTKSLRQSTIATMEDAVAQTEEVHARISTSSGGDT